MPLPTGAGYLDRSAARRAAYARCKWIGPGRGWVDPLKERQGEVLGLDAAFGTLEELVAEISGGDWRKKFEQRAIDVKAFKDRKLKPPVWAAETEDAQDSVERPQPA